MPSKRWPRWRLVERLEKPVDRYVMYLPLTAPFVELIRDTRVFREEALYLWRAAKEAFIPMSEIGDMPLAEGITVLDMLRFRRLFTIIAVVFFEALDQPVFGGDRDALDMRSRLPTFSEAKLLAMLGEVFGAQTAAGLLKLLTYDPKDGGHFDVQYTPLLKVDGYYMVSLSVLVSSDLIRKGERTPEILEVSRFHTASVLNGQWD